MVMCTQYNIVSGLRQVGDFLWLHWVSFTNKTDRRNLIEIVLKLALNTITLTYNPSNRLKVWYIVYYLSTKHQKQLLTIKYMNKIRIFVSFSAVLNLKRF